MKQFSRNITIAIVSASMVCAFNASSFASGSGSTGAPAPVESLRICKLKVSEDIVVITTDVQGELVHDDCENACFSEYLINVAESDSRNALVASGQAFFKGEPRVYVFDCLWGADDLRIFTKTLEMYQLEYISPEEAGDGPGPDLDGAA